MFQAAKGRCRGFCSVMAIAAHGCASNSSDDSATSQGTVGGVGGELASPLLIGELSPTPQTTPTDLLLTLNDDVDQLSVAAYVKGPGEMPLTTSCQTRRIYRIGPDAIEWRLGQTFSLPLEYTETLPDGLYEESVRILVATGVTLEIPHTAHFWVLDDIETRSGDWDAARGTVTIAPMSDGVLSVAFTDLILTNDRDSAVERALGSGTIVGRLQTQLGVAAE